MAESWARIDHCSANFSHRSLLSGSLASSACCRHLSARSRYSLARSLGMAQPSRRNGNEADVIRHVSMARQSVQPKKENPGHSFEPGILGHGRPWGPGVPAGHEENSAPDWKFPGNVGNQTCVDSARGFGIDANDAISRLHRMGFDSGAPRGRPGEERNDEPVR